MKHSLLRVFWFTLLSSSASISYANEDTFSYPKFSCDFLVEFPNKPSLYELSAVGTETTVAADLLINNSLLRAECIPNPYPMPHDSVTLAHKILFQYSEANGLSHSTVRSENKDGFTVSILRGYKTIEKIKVIYEAHTFWSKESVMNIIVSSKSTDFPTKEISLFLDSVHFHENSDH